MTRKKSNNTWCAKVVLIVIIRDLFINSNKQTALDGGFFCWTADTIVRACLLFLCVNFVAWVSSARIHDRENLNNLLIRYFLSFSSFNAISFVKLWKNAANTLNIKHRLFTVIILVFVVLYFLKICTDGCSNCNMQKSKCEVYKTLKVNNTLCSIMHFIN